ncbi:rhomboid family intramembrane serine protease [Minwuia sp.]|uniref:rhomboid family intramembrane serine protease n=1 Tax=Minwuia sp. TaxID=2493630 RepID=UPI003A935AE4
MIWTCLLLIAIHLVRSLLPPETDAELLFRGALIPAVLDQGAPYYWTLVTYMFLHADFGHVLINAAFILAIGSGVARLSSGPVFVTIFVLSGLGGGLAIYLFSDPLSPTIGASGGLNGLIGAAAVMFYRHRDHDPRARMMGAMVAIVLIMNVFLALTGASGISWQGHLGGLLAGLIYGYAALGRAPQRS